MKLISTVALLAALAVTPVLAQTSVSTGVSTGVGGGVSVEAGGASVGVDTGVSVEASASTETGSSSSSNGGANSGNGSSSQVGGANASSSAQNGSSSSQEPASGNSMTSDKMCATITSSNLATAMLDAAALEAVTSVTVLSTSDCSGLTDTVAAGADTQSNLRANAMVMEALQAQGDASAEIVGYVLDGTSLTVIVRNK